MNYFSFFHHVLLQPLKLPIAYLAMPDFELFFFGIPTALFLQVVLFFRFIFYILDEMMKINSQMYAFSWELWCSRISVVCFFMGILVFPKIGVSQNAWFLILMENPIKMDDLGVPLFLETSICSAVSGVFFEDFYHDEDR